ncbi:MAG: outer membrane protein assembly factor BamB family protein [Thermogutta sp.]
MVSFLGNATSAVPQRLIIWILVFGIGLPGWASASDLLNPQQLAPYGLEVAWFNQVQLDPAQARVAHWVLDRGTLFVVSDSAVVQAFDAETGRSLWATPVGQPNLLGLKPTAGEHLVSVVNGSTIYVLNRYTGVILWKRQTEGAVGAGPALSPTHVYVPLIRGKIESYRLEWADLDSAVAAKAADYSEQQAGAAALTPTAPAQEKTASAPTPAITPVASKPVSKEELRLSTERRPGQFVMSWGRALVEPKLTFADRNWERLAWPTDKGLLFVGELDVRSELRFSVNYFLQISGGDIVAPPCVRPGDPSNPSDPQRMLYVTATNGFVYALRERDGKLLWRFSSGEPINESPALIGDDLYVTTKTGGMYRLNSLSGELIWFARGIRRFVAASDQRVYGVDSLNSLIILEQQTGSRLGQFDVSRYPLRYMNADTDRIYLANESGLIQCLRESRLAKPIQHVVPITTPTKPTRPQPRTTQPTPGVAEEPKPQPPGQAPGENPFQ